jgi:hypothetical protein
MQTWWGSAKEGKGLLTDKLKRDTANRIIQSLQKSEEYVETVGADGRIIPADERLTKFIEDLGREAEIVRKGADGETIIEPTVADLASAAGLDFSNTLQTIQQGLVKSSEDLKVATGRGREQMLAGAVNAIRALTATGDPAALAFAARIQQALFEQNIMDGVDASVTKLMDSASKVLGRDAKAGSDRVNLSKKLYEVLENQIKLSKVRERRLWNEVGSYPLTQFFARNGKEIQQPNVLQLLDRPSRDGGLNFAAKGAQEDLKSALGKGYKEDIDDLRDYFQNGIGRNPATAQKFFEMRSGLLNRAAQLRKTGDTQNAGRLDKINDALLRDLTGQADGASEAYNAARAYTFARNNFFTRSFLSDLTATDRNRGLVLDPENLLDKFFQGGNLKTAQRFDQIRAAGRFLVKQDGLTEADVLQMDADEIMTAALRDSLGQVMDRKRIPDPLNPNKMREEFIVNETKLNTWKKQPGTKELFALVPDLEVDLTDAVSAQRAFDNMLQDTANTMNPSRARQMGFNEEQINRLYANKAFQNVLEFEDPGKAVTLALASQRPALALNKLYQMVNEANYAGSEFTRDQAMSGLKSAIFNSALRKANNTAGLPDGDSLQKSLFGQMDGVDPSKKFSMKDFMVKKGLATEDEMAEVQQAIKTLRGVEEAFAKGDFENVLFKNPSLAKLFYIRIAGATFGALAQQQLKRFLNMPQMSGGFIAEQTGSDLVQRVFLRGPETQRLQVLTEMLSNPKMLAAMMKEITNKKQADNAVSIIEKVFEPVARQTGRRLPLGIRPVIEEGDVEQEPIPIPTPSPPPVPQQGALSPPTVPNVPVPNLTQSSAINRADYAKMFPGDVVSDLIPEQMAQGGMVPSASIMADTSFTYNPMDTQTNGIRQALNPLGSYIQQSIAESSGINNIQPTLNEIADLVQQKFPTLENAPPMSNTGKITTSSPPLDGIGGLLEQLRAGSRGRPVPTRMPAPPLEMQNLQLAIQDSLNNLQEEEGPPLNRRLISFSGSQQGLTPMSQKPIPEQEPLLDEAQLKPTYGTIQNNTDKIVPQQLVILGEEPQKTGIQTLM